MVSQESYVERWAREQAEKEVAAQKAQKRRKKKISAEKVKEGAEGGGNAEAPDEG